MQRDHSSWQSEWSHDEQRHTRLESVALVSLVAILLILAGWSLYSAVA